MVILYTSAVHGVHVLLEFPSERQTTRHLRLKYISHIHKESRSMLYELLNNVVAEIFENCELRFSKTHNEKLNSM